VKYEHEELLRALIGFIREATHYLHMNPYQPINNPRLVTTIEQARTLLKQFDNEAAILISNAQQADDTLNATANVLAQQNPDLRQSLDELAFAAMVMGNIEGFRTDLDRMKSEFISALPLAIKQQLP
jgi:hypothetical protein